MTMEKYIRNNRAAFDDAPLPEGHRERFAARLARVRRRRIVVRLSGVAAAAAMVAAVVWFQGVEKNNCRLSPELADVNAYYSYELSEEVARAEELVRSRGVGERLELMAAVAEMHRESDALLATLCQAEIDTSQAIILVVEHYRLQIDAMEMTVESLKNTLL